MYGRNCHSFTGAWLAFRVLSTRASHARLPRASHTRPHSPKNGEDNFCPAPYFEAGDAWISDEITLFVVYMHHRVLNLTGKLSLFSEFVGETRGEEERSSIVHDSMQASSCKLTNFEVFFFFLLLYLYLLIFYFSRKRVFQPQSFSFLTLKGF